MSGKGTWGQREGSFHNRRLFSSLGSKGATSIKDRATERRRNSVLQPKNNHTTQSPPSQMPKKSEMGEVTPETKDKKNYTLAGRSKDSLTMKLKTAK